jgi:cation diffusion facilitator CzcD-associated flavoprotein CzcO
MPLFMANSHESAESVAITGGGFSGAILATRLLRKSAGSLFVLLIERNHHPGRGVAYGARCSGHLPNFSAKDMSAFPDSEHLTRPPPLRLGATIYCASEEISWNI